MDAALVGAFLSPTFQTILDNLTSIEFRDFLNDRKLNISLRDDLKITLIMLDAILNDAEEKQITSPAVKKWLQELKDAVYDAEDLLDEINTKSLRCQQHVEQDSQDFAHKVRSIIPSISEFYWDMNKKLEAIYQRLKNFAEQKDILHLQSVSWRARKKNTTSLINESIVVGREDDKEKLLNMLLCDENHEDNDIGVIPIWGMGGVGKTTLAQLVYNDEKVRQHFDLTAWACVSEDFNALEATRNLLESVTSEANSSKTLYFLQVELRNRLRDKKFLIVIDDLWSEKYSDWDDLVAPFHNGIRGSKIIVTTRHQRVAEITRTFPAYKLSTLSNENCWCLLAKHALKNEDLNKHPNLEAIGRKIARKCCGLPIAARSIGGLLRSKVDEKEWHKILDSNMWDLPSDDVLLALYLSYVYLPPHLKKCLAYCSIFPKDHLLDKKQLVLLWMAEGFVQQYSQWEIESDNCFNELLSRSFIQQHEGDPEKFILNNLIIDLAKFVSGNSSHCLEGDEIPKTNARHLSYPKQGYDGYEMFKSFYHLHSLRTFLPQQTWEFTGLCVLSKRVLHDLLPKLTYLRVLSLCMYSNITELPDSIGNLLHLRYLDLSYTKVTRLPDAAFTLYNLQTLLLSYCKFFSELPKSIEKLINLRHLDIIGTALKEMPTQITKLQNLHSLSTFVVGKQSNGLRIKELGKLPHLAGKLSILKLQNVVDSTDAFGAKLKMREKIEELVLEWDSDDSQDPSTSENVLNVLQPSTNLQRLTINHYGGASFPSWVGDSSFINITFLCMSNCKDCLSLPPFGRLPSLIKLSIQGMASVKIVGHEFYFNQTDSSSFHPFQSLEILRFEDMLAWEQWIPFEGEGTEFPFPSLKHLFLCNCPKLKGDMPKNLPSLRKVDILNCNQLEAKSSALKWINCIKKLDIDQGKKDLLRAIENDSLESLKRLRVTDCSSLQSLSRTISASHHLQKLYLRSIPSTESFPIHGLPTSLQRLRIEDCSKLEFPPQESWQNYIRLEFLLIKNSCDSLTLFPLGCFPKLKSLVVEGCRNLETFTQVEGSSSSLESLVLSDCKKLRSMSQVCIESLTTLKYFSFSQLPNLESLPQCGLPSNLRSFSIVDCVGLSTVPIKEWGFQKLASLSGLLVKGDGSKSILCQLLEYQLLPTSLMRIDICDFSNLKFLYGKGLRQLTCLEELYIYDCPELESLPEDDLPSSLLELNISGCPKLRKRYDYQSGRHLSKIAHIPTLQINGRYYDPWEASQERSWLPTGEGDEQSSKAPELPNKRDLFRAKKHKKDLLEAKSKLKKMKGDEDDLLLFW